MATIDQTFHLPLGVDAMLRAWRRIIPPIAEWADARPSSLIAAPPEQIERHDSATRRPDGPPALPSMAAIGVKPISPADSPSKAFVHLCEVYEALMDRSFVTSYQTLGHMPAALVPDSFAPAWEGAKGAREHSLLYLVKRLISGARSDAMEIIRQAQESKSVNADAEMNGRLSARCAIAIQFAASHLGPRGCFMLVESIKLALPALLPEGRIPSFLLSVVTHRLERPEHHTPSRWQRYIDGISLVIEVDTHNEQTARQLFS